MQYASWHILEMVGSCPVNYYTTKSQKDIGKNAYCSQKVRRKIISPSLWENRVYKTEFSNLMKGGRRVMTEEECYYKLK